MGKHSSPQQGPFYRSIVAWLLPWLLIAAVVIVAVWVAIDAVGRDDEKLVPVARASSPPPVDEPTEEPEETEETPEPVETKKPTTNRSKDPKPDRSGDEKLITTDVTIQVLNATGDPGADDRMADRLSSLGFEVVSIQGSSKEYGATTVFWSFPEAQEAAERLAKRFGWDSGPKPSNLSSTVDLHVVVGTDEA